MLQEVREYRLYIISFQLASCASACLSVCQSVYVCPSDRVRTVPWCRVWATNVPESREHSNSWAPPINWSRIRYGISEAWSTYNFPWFLKATGLGEVTLLNNNSGNKFIDTGWLVKVDYRRWSIMSCWRVVAVMVARVVPVDLRWWWWWWRWWLCWGAWWQWGSGEVVAVVVVVIVVVVFVMV